MSGLQIFNNDEFDLKVEFIGDTFEVQAPGLARGLGHRDAANMLKHVPDDEKGYFLGSTPGGDQRLWHVKEPGFYRVIGQRHSGRIKDEGIRAEVVRFQDWLYKVVLPALRKGVQPMRLGPFTYTWVEAAAIIRQDWGLDYGENNLTRLLRSAGVLKQGRIEPMAPYRDLFWFTGTAWEVDTRAIPFLVRKVDSTFAELRARRFVQTQLDVGLAGHPRGRVAG